MGQLKMTTQLRIDTAKELIADDKGILAMDEIVLSISESK